jgi:hypothetical protein
LWLVIFQSGLFRYFRRPLTHRARGLLTNTETFVDIKTKRATVEEREIGSLCNRNAIKEDQETRALDNRKFKSCAASDLYELVSRVLLVAFDLDLPALIIPKAQEVGATQTRWHIGKVPWSKQRNGRKLDQRV